MVEMVVLTCLNLFNEALSFQIDSDKIQVLSCLNFFNEILLLLTSRTSGNSTEWKKQENKTKKNKQIK